jgi:signal transduction histidine kinase
VLAAAFVGFLGGGTNFLTVYSIPVPPFGNGLVVIFTCLIAYAVVRHQLMDIRIAIRKSLIYSISVTCLTVGYFGLVYFVEKIFQTTFGYKSIGISLSAFALMALVFQPLKIAIQSVVDFVLFRAPHEELVKRMERLEQELSQAEKLKAVATLAAGMAHEIKNPLASIKTFAEYLPEKYDDPIFREKFARIMQNEVGKINALVERLLDFAKPAHPNKQPVRVSRLIEDTIEFLQGSLLNKKIEVVRSYSSYDELSADPVQIRQVFLNILLNSIEAVERPGCCISITTVAENGYIEVIFADTGRGVPKGDLSRIFDPFYTTKASGTGLGLSVVHSIVNEHGGSVSMDSDTGRGSTLRIRLPLS